MSLPNTKKTSSTQAAEAAMRQEAKQAAGGQPEGSLKGPAKKEVPRDPTGIIDIEIFEQILEMDEDDAEEMFSQNIVENFRDQAGTTFEEMKEALAQKDLPKLSSLGHFLKGSSAALGVIKVKDSCEKMQHYGQLRDEEAGISLTESEALKRIDALLRQVQEEYDEAMEWLKRYYSEKEADLQKSR